MDDATHTHEKLAPDSSQGDGAANAQVSAEAPAPADPREPYREIIRRWLREALKRAKLPGSTLSKRVGYGANMVSRWLSPTLRESPSEEALRRVARATGHAITDEVRAAREALRALPRHWRSRAIPPPDAPEAATVADEMSLLLRKATFLSGSEHTDRNFARLRSRFGLETGTARTLEEVAKEDGLTRERVRQVESKHLRILRNATELATPRLDELRERLHEHQGIPVAMAEQVLAPLLGNVPLLEALRFHKAIRPEGATVGKDAAHIYGQGTVPVLVGATGTETRLVEAISKCARKLYSYAGACLITDLRAFVEGHLRRDVPQARVVLGAEGLPGMRWVGSGKRWFTFTDDTELQSHLQRAATIIGLARRPVDFEVLYAGLTQYIGASSSASRYTDFLPPAPVLLDLLDNHPAFVRRVATSFALSGTAIDPLATMDTDEGALLRAMDAAGGVLCKADAEKVRGPGGKILLRPTVNVLLYQNPYIVRAGSGVHAIRGRDIEPDALATALARARATGTTVGRPTMSDGTFVASCRASEYAKSQRVLYLKKTEVPEGVAGTYRVPDGHETLLQDDRHGPRLVRLGEAVTALLLASEDTLRLHFDVQRRRLRVESCKE